MDELSKLFAKALFMCMMMTVVMVGFWTMAYFVATMGKIPLT